MTEPTAKRAAQARGTDWPALRLEYVNGSMSLAQLAEARGINPSGVMHHSAAEGWDAERAKVREQITRAAQAKLVKSRAEELAALNEATLKVAKALIGQAGARINLSLTAQVALPAVEVKTLAHAVAIAQTIGRTSLGMNDDAPLGEGEDTPDAVPVTIEFKDARRRKPDDDADAEK